MSRIDAVVATQVGDVVRPRQVATDSQQQTVQAQSVASQQVEQGNPVASTDLRAATAQLKQVIEAASGKKLSFEFDETSEQLLVQISDRETGEVIRQIPSEEIMKVHEKISELIGLMVDQSA